MSEVVTEKIPFKNYPEKHNWWSFTDNFWVGCEKISTGCKFCYMFREQERYKKDPTDIRRTKDNTFFKITKEKVPHAVFVNSYSDFFIEVLKPVSDQDATLIDVADGWRADAWKVMKEHPQHVFMIPTKRIHRVLQCLPEDWGDEGYPNVWIGTSVENQATADARIPLLAQIPAAVRFLSCEPLLEFVTFSGLPMERINWIITGGESGDAAVGDTNSTAKWRYRPTDHNAIKHIIDQASRFRIPVFMKQLGTHLAKQVNLKDRTGSDMSEPLFPIVLKVRQFPRDMDEFFRPELKEEKTTEKK